MFQESDENGINKLPATYIISHSNPCKYDKPDFLFINLVISCCWASFAFIRTSKVVIVFGQSEVWVQTIFLFLPICVVCLFGLQTLSINRDRGQRK